MKLSCWAFTSAGRRPENQDAVALPDIGLLADDKSDFCTMEVEHRGLLIALADGVGGRPAGRWAARTALANLTTKEMRGASLAEVSRAVETANHSLSKWEGAGLGPATTLAGIAVCRDGLTIFHVGDSRIYEISNTAVRLLTSDHRSKGDGRSITRYLGSNAHAIPTILETPIRTATFLLATDGFYGFLREADLLLCEEIEPFLALRSLSGTALENGCDDNLSAIILKVEV